MHKLQWVDYQSMIHFNKYVPFRTDLFSLKCQSDLLTYFAMKFDEESLVRASSLLAE